VRSLLVICIPEISEYTFPKPGLERGSKSQCISLGHSAIWSNAAAANIHGILHLRWSHDLPLWLLSGVPHIHGFEAVGSDSLAISRELPTPTDVAGWENMSSPHVESLVHGGAGCKVGGTVTRPIPQVDLRLLLVISAGPHPCLPQSVRFSGVISMCQAAERLKSHETYPPKCRYNTILFRRVRHGRTGEMQRVRYALLNALRQAVIVANIRPARLIDSNGPLRRQIK
jgi:hypothetical protein